MKKIVTTSVVVSTFLAYCVYQRFFGMQTPQLGGIPTNSSADSAVNPIQGLLTSPTPIASINPTTIPTTAPTVAPTTTPTARPTAVPTAAPTAVPTPTPKPTSMYKDGTFTGDAADAFYGNIQVSATISNGKITNVKFLQAPGDRNRSVQINSYADPILAQEAIAGQTANVDIVSGATDSSQAFIQSMQSALNKAKS